MSVVRPLVIAVDGPAAAGKGTLARALANAFELPYLDTGLLYRAVARRVLDGGGDPAADASEVAGALVQTDLARTDLRLPEVDRAASLVAGQPAVRTALLARQRAFAAETGAVVDGRDIGTVVFPDADVKFFVTASAQMRALRRHRQMHGDAVLEGDALIAAVSVLMDRDARDSGRETAPLREAEDAVRLETDRMTVADVLAAACSAVTARTGRQPRA